MWHKVNKPLKDVTYMDCPDPFKNKVKCEECKHYIDKKDGFEVTLLDGIYAISRWYCPMHKKPYSSIFFSGSYGYKKDTYFAEVEVSEDGIPVGYEKIKEKKV